ncbi:IS5 family transposase [Plastoroseomonas hellenica]|uniref:IS5 family transposase n=1 Tax=Plastoroseomonas hellenica TaxID=2687306 RepID=UPI0038D24BC8
MSGSFWLSDAQWERLRPLLPNKPRGVPRVDDRRVISGIVVALQSGGRWIDVPADYGPRKTLYNRFVRWSAKGIWREIFEALASAGGPPAEVLLDSTYVKAHRCATGGKGARAQALGISRGGRTTKIHALSDGQGRPLAFALTAGQAADCRAAETLLQRLAPSTLVMADRAYDTNAVRQQIEQQGAVPNIPPKRTRRWKYYFSPVLYRGRNAIERMFCRLKDFRRIATRYDKLATNFLSAVYVAATVSYWL